MQYDDIANDRENPFKGQVFNKPTKVGTPGVDVYGGCKKDYTGKWVTPEMFVAVMTGDDSKTGGRPVLKSTAQDRVFINFVDHGGTGIIAFPDGSTMSSKTLNAALKTMFDKKMYSKLVFYMEACESGSMFAGQLSPDLNIYVTTAANAVESSWGTYCPPDDKVDGKELNTCLGDLYSVNWMENADEVGPKESLQDQYTKVKTETTKSHVMQYGNTSWTSEPIGNYLGDTTQTQMMPTEQARSASSNVKSSDIPMHLAYYKYLRAGSDDFEGRKKLALELQRHITRHMEVDQLFMNLATKANKRDAFFANAQMPVVCDDRCCTKLRDAFSTYCGGFDDYVLKYQRVIVNVCAAIDQQPDVADNLASMMKAMCM
jgi:legumain